MELEEYIRLQDERQRELISQMKEFVTEIRNERMAFTNKKEHEAGGTGKATGGHKNSFSKDIDAGAYNHIRTNFWSSASDGFFNSLDGTGDMSDGLKDGNLELFAKGYLDFNWIPRISEGFTEWNKLNTAIFDTGKALGRTGFQMDKMTTYLTDKSDALNRFFNIKPDEFVKTIEEVAEATGRVRIPSLNDMYSQAFLTHFKANDLIGAFDDLGGSTTVATANFLKIQQNSTALGLNLKKVKDSLKESAMLHSKITFKEGISGLEKMVMLTQQMKISMKDVATIVDKFSTVESAIQASADLNALGGSISAQFSNPLEMMNLALTDAEGLVKKYTDSLANAGTFNWKTGTVDIDPVTKMLLKQEATTLGVDFESTLKATNRQALEKAMLTQIDNGKFNQAQRDMITNRAEYDAESGRFKVSIYDENDKTYKDKDINELSVSDLSNLVSQDPNDAQLDIRDNVRDIAHLLKTKLTDNSVSRMSLSEIASANAMRTTKKYMKLADSFTRDTSAYGGGFIERGRYVTRDDDDTASALYSMLGLEGGKANSNIEGFITTISQKMPTNALSKVAGEVRWLGPLLKGGIDRAQERFVGNTLINMMTNATVDRSDLRNKDEIEQEERITEVSSPFLDGVLKIKDYDKSTWNDRLDLQTNPSKYYKFQNGGTNDATGRGANYNSGYYNYRSFNEPFVAESTSTNATAIRPVQTADDSRRGVKRSGSSNPASQSTPTSPTYSGPYISQYVPAGSNTFSGHSDIPEAEPVVKNKGIKVGESGLFVHLANQPNEASEATANGKTNTELGSLETDAQIAKYIQQVEGVVDINDPLLANKAFTSVIKIHELLVARYGVMELQRHDVAVKDNVKAIEVRNRSIDQSALHENISKAGSGSKRGSSEKTINIKVSFDTLKLDVNGNMVKIDDETAKRIGEALLNQQEFGKKLKAKIQEEEFKF